MQGSWRGLPRVARGGLSWTVGDHAGGARCGGLGARRRQVRGRVGEGLGVGGAGTGVLRQIGMRHPKKKSTANEQPE